jgi:bifunctional UDP-N-acetylglucosamine pyrophosphorylase/glucosamine-1-phosphate N-acetyltransferase
LENIFYNMPQQTTNALVTIILAAGKGTRMNTSLPKVLNTLRGRPILDAVLDTASDLDSEKVIVISGHGADAVRSTVGERSGNYEVIVQEPQLGTGHAVYQCLEILADFDGTVLVLSGDVPNLKPETVRNLARSRIETGSDISILTGHIEDPAGYGRIIRTPDGMIMEIREQRDLSEDQESIKEVNLGVYAFDAAFLTRELPNLSSDNAQGEYYLTDLAKAAVQSGNGAASHTTGNHSEALGINTLRELSKMEMRMNREYMEKLMDSGVRIVDPDRTWIDETVSIEPEAVIHPTAFLYGQTTVGAGSVIGPGAVITDSTIGRKVLIKPYCVITSSNIDDNAEVGPFAHMRPGTEIKVSGKIGNFVETKAAVIGEGSKVSHLAYVGNAELGPGVNIGAGCVTCNYDGFNKYKTVIEEGVFVGSGTMIVAPITLGKGSLIAAGSTLTQDVPPDSLAIARSQQSIREGWAAARREKLTKEGKKENN